MKKSYSIIILVVCFISCKITQNKPDVKIQQSILKTPISVPECIKSGSQVVFEFDDVNSFLYSIEFKEYQRDLINDEEITNNEYKYFYKPQDYKISELTLDDFSFPEYNRTAAVDSINKIDGLIKLKKLQVEQLHFNIIKSDLDLNSTIQLKRDSLSGLNTDSLAAEGILNTDQELKNFKKLMQEQKNDSQKLVNEIDDQIVKKEIYIREQKSNEAYLKSISENLINYLNSVSKINGKVDLYQDLLFLLFSSKTYDEIITDKNKIIELHFNNIIKSSEILFYCNKIFDDLDSNYYSIVRTYTLMPNKEANVEKSYSKFLKYHSSIKKADFQELFKQILKVYNSINQENWRFRYHTTIISDKADKIFYSIQLTPIVNEYSLGNKPIKLNYDFDVINGVKIDVSAGIFFHYKLYDDNYRFVKLTDTTTALINDTDENQLIPSAAVMLNIYKRSKANLKLGGNFGLGTDIEKLYYYLGTSLLIGKSERIGIGAGIVGGTVRRILPEYNISVINTPIENLPTDVPIQVNNPFKVGYYFGISYNLSGKNKDSIGRLAAK